MVKDDPKLCHTFANCQTWYQISHKKSNAEVRKPCDIFSLLGFIHALFIVTEPFNPVAHAMETRVFVAFHQQMMAIVN